MKQVKMMSTEESFKRTNPKQKFWAKTSKQADLKEQNEVRQPILKKVAKVAIPTFVALAIAFYVLGGKFVGNAGIKKSEIEKRPTPINIDIKNKTNNGVEGSKNTESKGSKKDNYSNNTGNQIPSIKPAQDNFFDYVKTTQKGDIIETTSVKNIRAKDGMGTNFIVAEESKMGDNNKKVKVGLEFEF